MDKMHTDTEHQNPLLPGEELLKEKFSRRSFLKGLAFGTAAVSLATILPGCGNSGGGASSGTTAAAGESSAADSGSSSGSGIFIDGGNTNMDGQTYTLEFIQPVHLVAMVDGKQPEGTWRSTNRHLVSVDPDGTIRMRDGVGGHSVDVLWTRDDTEYKVTFLTGQTAGGESIEIDSPIRRGDFMKRLADYFGWYHYNNFMDDGTDIDDDGNLMTDERVRSYKDVTGDAVYVKPIEEALDMGVLHADSADEEFYPMSDMTREDAAVILCSAFHIPESENDVLANFSDVSQVNKDCYAALNSLFAGGYMRGRSSTTINPTEGITDTEERLIIEAIDRRNVCPVWSLPVSNRKFVRCRPTWFTATKGATVHWRCRGFNISDSRLEGLFIGDRGNGVTLSSDWGQWNDYTPGFTTVPMFGLNNCYDFPYDNVYFCVEVECYATKDGLAESPHTHFIWRIDRPAWHDFATDKLHEGTADYPTVYRFFDNFQAAAYYIEGTKSGILYDGLMPTHTTTSLIDKVNAIATKPYIFVLGHNHGDHKGALAHAYHAGLDCYMCDRTGPQETEWKIETYNKDWTDANPVVDDTVTGTYTGGNVHLIDEGDTLDIGNATFEVYRLPGHEDAMIILYDRKHGLLFSSDIYGVNRYWVADQFSARGVKQDLVLSLQQQLMDAYRKDGAEVKELYTGHNRTGVGADYLMVWEQALQNLVDYGPDGVSDDLRGDGALVARNGDPYATTNWQAIAQNGKQVVAEYTGQYDGKKFTRIEVDETGGADGKTPKVESNLYFDYRSNASLSDIVFTDAELVGHDFKYKAGQDSQDEVLPDGRLKFVVPNKFVPFEYDYDVNIGAGQAEVTMIPTTMSTKATQVTVNGKPAASRCPVKVDTSAPAVVEVTGPDGTTKSTYTFTFRTA